MANVKFKRGSQASLNTLIQGGVFDDGCFYLTSDTDRLYVAQSANELVELNKSITVVDSVAELPTSGVEVGQFYYISGTNQHQDTANGGNNGNILAVCTSCNANGTNPHWTQVNPDTNDNDNDNDWVSGFSITRNAANAAQQSPTSLVYDWAISQKDVDGHDLTDSAHALSGQFSIPIADIVSSGVNVGLAASKSGDDLVISPNGTGANTSASVTIVAGNNVSFDASGSNYSLSATDTTYTQVVDASTKKIDLKEDGTTTVGSTTFADGTSIGVTVAASGTNNENATVTISHANVTRGTDTVSDAELGFGDDLTVVTGITTNAQGHVTQVATKKMILPDETPYSITSIGVDSTDKSKLTVSYSDGSTTTPVTSSTQDLFFTYGADANAATNPKVLNQGNLSIYTRAEIDQKIAELDGMTYKGVVPSAGLPSTGVKNGDTYKVNREGLTIPGTSDEAKIGDLFIATGTEGTDGIIFGTVTWDYIPSGDETDTTYTFGANNNIISLSNVVDNTDVQNVTIAGGNKLSASTVNNTITIDHDTTTTTGALSDSATAPTGTNNLDFGDTFTVVHGAKADGYGHITEIQTETFQLPDAPEAITYSLVDTASSGSHGNGKVELQDNDGNPAGEIAFQNGNLTTAVVTRNVNKGNAIVQVNHNTVSQTHTNNTTGDGSTIDVTNGFNAITALGFDNYGHVNAYTTTKFVLPDDAFVTLSGNISGSSNAVTIGFDLTDSGSGSRNATGASVPQYTLSSSSLTINTTAATASTPADIAVDLVWGTF